ncbi:hypothetical protein ABT063_19085 [Streptomyces sp. NPDC002838]|uniref:hypothetical protein n=1 Tax=Streptomyces sp. NPDC002838 TaxID=3154436 RepID=UPI0033251441
MLNIGVGFVLGTCVGALVPLLQDSAGLSSAGLSSSAAEGGVGWYKGRLPLRSVGLGRGRRRVRDS